jgi:hypothetical protein
MILFCYAPFPRAAWSLPSTLERFPRPLRPWLDPLRPRPNASTPRRFFSGASARRPYPPPSGVWLDPGARVRPGARPEPLYEALGAPWCVLAPTCAREPTTQAPRLGRLL